MIGPINAVLRATDSVRYTDYIFMEESPGKSESNDSARMHKASGRTVRMRAFTAIDLIGVLKLISLIAAAVIPNVIRRIDRAVWERETQDLNTLAQGLVQAIKTDRRVPALSGIATVIANYRNLAVNQVTNTPRRLRRVIQVDPNLTIGSVTALSTDYVQSNTGPTTRPVNTRLLFLSTIALPEVSTISDSFATIWETPEGGKPSSWAGKADDLKIQRLELGGLFHKLRLHNIDSVNGWYTFDTNSPSAVASFTSLTVYILDGTAVNLYMTNSNFLQLREILTQDESFVYQRGHWARDLTTPQMDSSSGPVVDIAAQFLAAGLPPQPENGATPQGALESFYNYMVDYIIWSNGDPAHGIPNWQGGGLNSGPSFPYFKVLNAAQVQLDGVTFDLIK